MNGCSLIADMGTAVKLSRFDKPFDGLCAPSTTAQDLEPAERLELAETAQGPEPVEGRPTVRDRRYNEESIASKITFENMFWDKSPPECEYAA